MSAAELLFFNRNATASRITAFLDVCHRTSSVIFTVLMLKDGTDSEMQLRAPSSDADQVSCLGANASSTIGREAIRNTQALFTIIRTLTQMRYRR
jgi:hypothetical protein